MKIIICILTIIIIIILLCCFYGCGSNEPFQYSGNDVALYTEAIYSILGADGIQEGSRRNINPSVFILEEDSYGRILFGYYEGSLMRKHQTFLLISQRTEEEFVYYYPDYNFLIVNNEDKRQNTSAEYGVDKQSWWESAPFVDQIAELKAANDWDQEVDLNKCIKQIVTHRKKDPLSDKEKNELYKETYGKYEKDGYLYLTYSSMDDEGKFLYFAKEWSSSSLDFRMLIVDGDAHYCQKITDPTAYQEELAAFKREHNWKKS